MTATDPAFMTLAEAAAALKSGAVSSRELTEACLNRMARLDPKLHAVAGLDEADALAQADAADRARAEGGGLGALHGVPLAHKDMYYREGRVSACGSVIRKDFVPDHTATALRRLDAAGALDIARLHMVEFAFGVTGHNAVAGTPRNPWNTDHMTGGSSSGAGAAVAARLCFGALGSDTGGSIRLPAACCGLVGMKPTYGRVSRHGAMPLAHSLDTVGPLTRTVRDNALMMQAIAGFDANDPVTAEVPVGDYLAGLDKDVRGLKVGMPESFFYDGVAPEVRALVDASLKVFEDLGCVVVPVKIPDAVQIMNRLTNLITATEGAAVHTRWMAERAADYGPQTRARLAIGLFTPASLYLRVLTLRKQLTREFCDQVFGRVDALHTPLMVMPVPTLAESDMAANPGFADYLLRIGHNTRPGNFLGLPGLNVPCGFTPDGLPCSFQLMGRPYDEGTLYRLGHAYQQATDWHGRAPEIARQAS
ncbi:MAG: Asp-tRNA(Asn)/Glu-tRNA(Gln) amidotransferase GatCAB subunit A [Rhodospirillales bacterium CG15_BIG_FIL_POST_REV_8_21_14_020_66_15]|nr:MAG: Asp-tRNA(Asn)/Glu-tRNA(Gln) amidotransferase GatCAB subunit A [Rhodospirillales bacterium CG15_BIG_FIL_POST_REV_8_21_14_020_66_15]